MKKNLCILTLSLLVGCSLPQPQYQTTSNFKRPTYQPRVEVIETSEQQLEAAKETLKKSLKDPYSAVIEEIYAVQIDGKEGSISYCGLVNAKNSYGGYTGIKPFRITPSKKIFLWDDRGPSFNRGIIPYCPNLNK